MVIVYITTLGYTNYWVPWFASHANWGDVIRDGTNWSVLNHNCAFVDKELANHSISTAVTRSQGGGSLVPRLPRPAFVAFSMKFGLKTWKDLSLDVCFFWRHLIGLASQRSHVATIARALSMLASTAEKATWCVWSFCLVKSSYEIVLSCGYVSGMHHVINPSRPSPRFSYCKQQKLGVEAWERG